MKENINYSVLQSKNIPERQKRDFFVSIFCCQAHQHKNWLLTMTISERQLFEEFSSRSQGVPDEMINCGWTKTMKNSKRTSENPPSALLFTGRADFLGERKNKFEFQIHSAFKALITDNHLHLNESCRPTCTKVRHTNVTRSKAINQARNVCQE